MQYLGHMIFCRSRFTSAYKALSLWKQSCVGPELLRGRPRPPWTTESSATTVFGFARGDEPREKGPGLISGCGMARQRAWQRDILEKIRRPRLAT